RCSGVCVKRRTRTIRNRCLAQALIGLSAFLRRSSGRFLFLLWPDADLLEKWLDRLFAAQELLDRNVDVTRIARLIDLAVQFHAGLFVEVAVLRFFKNGRHVGCDRICPRVPVVTRILATEMSTVGNI